MNYEKGVEYRNILFRTSVARRARLEAEAAREDRSLSSVCNLLIEEALARRAEMEARNDAA